MSRLILSLTSIPTRFEKTWQTLESLLAQTAEIEAICLNIPNAYRRFPDWDGTLPQVPEGVTVLRCDDDWGPATKLLGAVSAYRGQDVDILHCDDDRWYDPRWAQRFLDARARHPGCIIANLGFEAHWVLPGSEERDHQPRAVRRWRVTDIDFQLRYVWQDLRNWKHRKVIPEPMRRVFSRSGYMDIFEGCAGVLSRPEYFDDQVFDIPPVNWAQDDIWLSGMAARNGIPIWIEANIREPLDTEAEQFSPLHSASFGGADRGEVNRLGIRNLRETFGIWT